MPWNNLDWTYFLCKNFTFRISDKALSTATFEYSSYCVFPLQAQEQRLKSKLTRTRMLFSTMFPSGWSVYALYSFTWHAFSKAQRSIMFLVLNKIIKRKIHFPIVNTHNTIQNALWKVFKSMKMEHFLFLVVNLAFKHWVISSPMEHF